MDNAGNLDANNHKFFYLKDHLGSVHAVIDSTNAVVSAQDYDAWGYIMDGRSYAPENSMYKFTGKERDKDIENNYDYFGARYYNCRIGNWTSIDPLFQKHFDFSPYNYVLRNPIRLIDPDGKQSDYLWRMIQGPEEGPGLVQNSGRILTTEEAVTVLENTLRNEIGNMFNSIIEGEASTGIKMNVSVEEGLNEEISSFQNVEVTEGSISKLVNSSLNFAEEKQLTSIKYENAPWERTTSEADMTKVGSYNRSQNIGSEVRIGRDLEAHGGEFHMDFKDASTKIKITFYKDQ